MRGSAAYPVVNPADPDVSYSWTTPGGSAQVGADINIASATPGDGGSYSVTATASGCTSAATAVTAVVNPIPTIATGDAISVCAGADITLSSTPSATGTISWTGPGGFSSSDEDPVITGAATSQSGTYTVNITVNGCTSADATQAVTVNEIPDITVSYSNPTDCSNPDGTITISGLTAGAAYDISYGAATLPGITAGAGGSYTITGVAAGSYGVSVTSAAGCSSGIENITMAPPGGPAAPVITGTATACEGGGIALAVDPASAGVAYSWTSPSGNPAGSGAALNLDNASLSDGGIYTVTIDSNGCTGSSTVTVTINPNQSPDFTFEPVCQDSAAPALPATAPNGISGSWSPAAIDTDVPFGSYTYTFTPDAGQGCMAASSFDYAIQIIDCSCQNPAGADAGNDQSICAGADVPLSGSITAATGSQWATSGSGTFSDGGSLSTIYTPSAADITAGSITLTLTTTDPDGTGPCAPASDAMTVTITPVQTATFDPIGPLCLNSAPPALPATSQNGIAGTWSPAAINTGATGAATYTFTPSAGCDLGATMTITVNPASPVPVVSGADILCAGSTTTFTATLAGGNWSSSNTAVATVNAATGVVTGTGNGTADIIYTYTDGCGTTSGSQAITIGTPTATPAITGPGHVCGGSAITLTGNAAGGWWSSSNTAVATIGAANGIVTGIAPGTTTITYGITGGCDTSYNTFTVTVDTNITAGAITGINELCEEGTTQLSNAAGTPGGTWSSSDAAIATVSATGLVTAAAAGDATITYTVNSGCGAPASAAYNLTVHPNIANAVDTAICYGDTLHLGNQVLTQSGVYSEPFQTAYGCDSIVTLTLHVHPPATMQDIYLDSCGQVTYNGTVYTQSTSFTNTYPDQLGCDSLIRNINITIGHEGFDTLKVNICQGESYHFNGNDYTATGRYGYTTPGVNGCDSTITLDLKVSPLPVIKISITAIPQHGFCIGDTISLYAAGAQSYAWENGYGKLLGTGDTATALLMAPDNIIKVTGVDTNGCSDTAGIVLTAEPCCTLLMPNAFSPNGDGRNDRFGPVTDGHPEGYRFQVFDRWGQRVFVSFRAEDQWDGTINGKPAPVATYYYYLTGKCANGTDISQKGEFTLVR